MGKAIQAKRYVKLSLFLSLLCPVMLTLAPFHGTLAWDEGSADTAEATLTNHMNFMVQQFPDMEGKRAQVQEQLANGKMPHEACAHCHVKGKGSGSANP